MRVTETVQKEIQKSLATKVDNKIKTTTDDGKGQGNVPSDHVQGLVDLLWCIIAALTSYLLIRHILEWFYPQERARRWAKEDAAEAKKEAQGCSCAGSPTSGSISSLHQVVS